MDKTAFHGSKNRLMGYEPRGSLLFRLQAKKVLESDLSHQSRECPLRVHLRLVTRERKTTEISRPDLQTGFYSQYMFRGGGQVRIPQILYRMGSVCLRVQQTASPRAGL